MNYINLTKTDPTLNINLNYDFNTDEGRNGDDIDFIIYKDGSDTEIGGWSGNLVDFKYHQVASPSASALRPLEDETQYNLVGINSNDDSVVYRGKFQTTQKNITDYSINKNVYVKKTTATNYTILD